MFQYPYPIPIYNNFQENNNMIKEIQELKDIIKNLEERIYKLENNKNTNYLKKDDSYYMI